MPGQRNAIGGCEERGGCTGLQVFGARSYFAHREKERHKGRLDEAEMRATPEANSDREILTQPREENKQRNKWNNRDGLGHSNDSVNQRLMGKE